VRINALRIQSRRTAIGIWRECEKDGRLTALFCDDSWCCEHVVDSGAAWVNWANQLDAPHIWLLQEPVPPLSHTRVQTPDVVGISSPCRCSALTPCPNPHSCAACPRRLLGCIRFLSHAHRSLSAPPASLDEYSIRPFQPCPLPPIRIP
jgi:hypothetical protein